MRPISVLLIALLVFANPACSTMHKIPPSELKPDEKVRAVVYRDGRTAQFQKITHGDTMERGTLAQKGRKSPPTTYGVVFPERNTIEGTLLNGNTLSVPLDSVRTVHVSRVSVGRTILYGSLFFIGFTALAIAVSGGIDMEFSTAGQ